MNAREELAREIFLADNSNAPAGMMEKEWAENSTKFSYAHMIAEGLLAAGYSKPRTISTVEELDALPDATVVMDAHGEVARKLVYGWRVLVSESGFDAWLSDPLEETYLPATVLYTPKES